MSIQLSPWHLGIVGAAIGALAIGWFGRSAQASPEAAAASAEQNGKSSIEKITKTDQEWRQQLSAMGYRVLRKAGTEPAFTGKTWNEHRAGEYRCAGCALPLFSSATKFDSGTGWPSFWAPIAPQHIETHSDRSFGMTRTEVVCARCGGHLGHVFPDGPKPTGLRYCMNSAALEFVPSAAAPAK